ncbi:hypothetical protein R1flu_021040 [Riccia fluitans]|uniref:RING-type domain-containing protein n=1 Tax=Riccia fluitans TaxID=41844 RepID=A0ABD1ZPF1_9MARC
MYGGSPSGWTIGSCTTRRRLGIMVSRAGSSGWCCRANLIESRWLWTCTQDIRWSGHAARSWKPGAGVYSLWSSKTLMRLSSRSSCRYNSVEKILLSSSGNTIEQQRPSARSSTLWSASSFLLEDFWGSWCCSGSEKKLRDWNRSASIGIATTTRFRNARKMPKILRPKLMPGNSPQFVLALQSPLYQAAHTSSSRFQNVANGPKQATRSRAKMVESMVGEKRGPSRAPTGPVRGMRGLAYQANVSGVTSNGSMNGSLRRDVDSPWVNVMISTEAPESAQLHNITVEVKGVPAEPAAEVKQEFDDDEPVTKRPRMEEYNDAVEEPSSGAHANTPSRIEIQATRSQLPEAQIPEFQEAMEKVQDSGVEPSGTEECTSRGRNDHHVRFLNCVTLVLQESSGFLKKSAESGSFQPSYDELRTFQCNAKHLLDQVDQGIHLFRIREMQRINAEKVKAESDAAADRKGLVSKIASLDQEKYILRAELGELVAKIGSLERDNASVRAACTKLEMQVERLVEEMAEAEKKLETEADKEKHASELAREFVALQDRFTCQICCTNPRDGLILPCLHLLYCYQCLEKHKEENKDCPSSSCRCRISAVLQCNLTS